MREKRRGKRFLAWALVLMMALSLLPMSALAAEKGSNYFYFMSSTENDAIVIATKVLHEGDDNVTDFGDVVVPVDATHGVAGWYADKELTNQVTELSYDAARTMPVPLYPKIEEGFWVTFESNGGSYIAPQFFAGHAAAPTTEPTKFGYTFAGWYTDTEFANEANFENISAPVTVYAKWAAADAKYTVIHWQENADDDGYSYAESEVLTGQTGAETSATAKNYDGFDAQSIKQETIAGDNSTIVNVYYKRKVYEVKFWNYEVGDGCWLRGEELSDKRITAKYGADIHDNWPGGVWQVGEWEAGDVMDSRTFQVHIEVMPLGGAQFGFTYMVFPHGADYYVESIEGDYVWRHQDTGAPVESIITVDDQYEINGFTFDHVTPGTWSEEEINQGYEGNKYVGAKFYYTRNSYDVVYMNNSEDPVKTTPYKYEANISNAGEFVPDRPDGIPDNYIFAGWYSDEECKAPCDFTGKIMPANNITVYAKWEPAVYTVTFKKGEDVLQTVSSVRYETKLSAVEHPNIGLQEGEFFYGWTLDEDGTQPVSESTLITKDITLYAQINDGSSYTVTYDANGGTGAVSDTYRYARNRTAMVLSGSGLTAPSGRSSFQGWNTAADGSGTMYRPSEPIRVSDNITLYAIWKRSYNPPYTPPTVEIPDEDALGLNTDDHFAYIIGYPDGTVQPNGQITRAEATTIFFRLLTDESRENFWSTSNGYPDVSAGQWYNNAISTMTKAGIVDGYPDGTFRPDAPITRAEMAKIISLFAKLDKSESRFSDIAGHWAERYIELAAGNGWIEGYPDGTFGPQRNITRAETATMINRVLGRVPSEESRLLSRDVMQIWPDSNPGDWFYLAMQEASNSHDYERNAKWAAADEQWTALRANRDWKMLEK